jgi:hypothetical protein
LIHLNAAGRRARRRRRCRFDHGSRRSTGAQDVVRPHFIGDGLGLTLKLCRTLKKSVWPGALFFREARESFA